MGDIPGARDGSDGGQGRQVDPGGTTGAPARASGQEEAPFHRAATATSEVDALRREIGRLRGMMEGSYLAAAAAQEEGVRLRAALASAEAAGVVLRNIRASVEDAAEQARVAAAAEAATQAEAAWARSRAEIADMRAGLLAEADHMRTDLLAETARLREALEHAREALRRGEEGLAALHASTSWRLTAPLRRVVRGLRGG